MSQLLDLLEPAKLCEVLDVVVGVVGVLLLGKAYIKLRVLLVHPNSLNNIQMGVSE